MPALFVFLLKVNVALLIFCLGYYLVLRKLTFYTLNRVYLVLAIVLSSVYPLINLNDFVQRHQQLAAPVQKVAINWQMPVARLAEEPAYWYWAGILFWLGAIVFAVKLAIQLLSLYKLYLNSKPGKIQDHAVRITAANVSPFSFWQNIYINPDNIDAKDLKSILQHEQVHVTEWHTLDILLAEISVIFYWFNPGVWFMKKAVRENIEFITDRKILQKGMDSKAYQYSLLNVSIAATASAGITNHFNFSTLKKRIKMMNAKRSSNVNLTRYAFLLPAVLICLFVFSVSKAELVKNTRVAYKKVAASVHNLVAVTNQKPVTPKKKLVPAKPADTIKKIRKDVSMHIIRDTGVHKNFNYNFSYDTNRDSSGYYVDGKKVTKDQFQKLQPGGGFQKIQVMDDRNGISSDGKKIVAVKVNGKVVDVNNTNVHPTILTSVKDTAKTHVVYTIVDKAYKNLTTSNFAYTITSDNNGDSDSKSVAKGYKTFTSNGIRSTVLTPNSKPWKNYYIDGVILIDGKAADIKALRKLSPLDIQSITPVDADDYKGKLDEYVKKYGDKAKNGVVYIVTKKAK